MESTGKRRISFEEYETIKKIAEKLDEELSYEEYYVQPADLENMIKNVEKIQNLEERKLLIDLISYILRHPSERFDILKPLLPNTLEFAKITIEINEEKKEISRADFSKEAKDLIFDLFMSHLSRIKIYLKLLSSREYLEESKKRLQEISKEMKEINEYYITNDLKIREEIVYDKTDEGIYQLKSILTLIYKDREFNLNSLLPEEVIFYRYDVSLPEIKFAFLNNFPHSLFKGSQKRIKVVLYGKLSHFFLLLALFHEIGHAIDFSKNEEIYKEHSGIEIDVVKERRANAIALSIIRRLRNEGYLPKELFENENLFNAISAQLFRKKLEINPGEFHPYLKRRLPEIE